MNNNDNNVVAFVLGLLVAILLLFIVNVGRASYILNNMQGVDSGAVRRDRIEMQLESINEIDNELMSNKYQEELR